MNMIMRGIHKMAVPAALVGLGLLSGVKANAQVLFNYTSSTIFNTSGTSVLTQGGTTIRVDQAADNNDNAGFPGTDLKLGAFVVNASGPANDVFNAVPYTTTLTISPLGAFAGNAMTFLIHGTLNTTVNATQVNNTFIGIGDLPQTKNLTVGINTLDLTASGFLAVGPGGTILTNQPHFDGINPPLGTAAGGFTIHVSGAAGQTTTPEPGSIALLVGMGVSGSVFLRRKRSK